MDPLSPAPMDEQKPVEDETAHRKPDLESQIVLYGTIDGEKIKHLAPEVVAAALKFNPLLRPENDASMLGNPELKEVSVELAKCTAGLQDALAQQTEQPKRKRAWSDEAKEAARSKRQATLEAKRIAEEKRELILNFLADKAAEATGVEARDVLKEAEEWADASVDIPAPDSDIDVVD